MQENNVLYKSKQVNGETHNTRTHIEKQVENKLRNKAKKKLWYVTWGYCDKNCVNLLKMHIWNHVGRHDAKHYCVVYGPSVFGWIGTSEGSG